MSSKNSLIPLEPLTLAFPEWAREPEAMDILDELTRLAPSMAHTAKLHNTIIMLVDARANGRHQREVFSLPECYSGTYYYNEVKPFSRPIEEALYRFARLHLMKLASADIEIAHTRIAKAAPIAATQLIRLAAKGSDDRIRLQAAESILDRASTLTGVKTLQQVDRPFEGGPKVLDLSRLSIEEIEALEQIQRKLLTDEDIVDGEVKQLEE